MVLKGVKDIDSVPSPPMWLVPTRLQAPELESNIRSMADVLYHEETRVSSGESVHRRGLEGEGGIPSSRMSTGRTFKSTSARA